MIGGNPNDFPDRIYSCQDTIYIYKGINTGFRVICLIQIQYTWKLYNINQQTTKKYGAMMLPLLNSVSRLL